MILNNLSKSFAIIIASLSLLSVDSFTKPNAALAGNFSKTCILNSDREKRLSEIDTGQEKFIVLHAACKLKDRTIYNPTSLIISFHIANYGGNLSWAKPLGRFNQSCNYPRVDDVQYAVRLTTRCRIRHDSPETKDTYINLDQRISNQNGQLSIDESDIVPRECISIPGPASVPVCK